MKEAIAATDAARSVFAEKSLLPLWAKTTYNLAVARLDLFDLSHEADQLVAARDDALGTHEVFEEIAAEAYLAKPASLLAEIDRRSA